MGTAVERVFVGISGSVGNLSALHAAAIHARHHGVPLAPVVAWTPPGGETGYRRAPWKPILELCEQRARERIDTALIDAFGACPADLVVTPVIIRGAAGPALVHVARHPKDLLVVGSGHGGTVSRLWHGGVSRYCVRSAHCPVLVVRPPEMLAELSRHFGMHSQAA